jgi:hypothetical protein
MKQQPAGEAAGRRCRSAEAVAGRARWFKRGASWLSKLAHEPRQRRR